MSKNNMSNQTTSDLTESRKLARWVRDQENERWRQIYREFKPPAATQPSPVYHATPYLDFRSIVDKQKVASLLREGGINLIPGEPLNSSVQQLHISAQIGELNRVFSDQTGSISSIEDILNLSSSDRKKVGKKMGANQSLSQAKTDADAEEAEFQRSEDAIRQAGQSQMEADERLRRLQEIEEQQQKTQYDYVQAIFTGDKERKKALPLEMGDWFEAFADVRKDFKKQQKINFPAIKTRSVAAQQMDTAKNILTGESKL
jgi:hypothetical protein